MRRVGLPIIVLTVLGAVGPRRSQAATPSESAAAQALFDKARQLMSAGKYALACPKLEESQRLDPSTGTLLNLGACYQNQGRLASAWTKFLEAEASARASGSTERAAAAHDRAAVLAPRLAKMVINVGEAHSQGLEVRRDGELVGVAQWGVAIPVDTGEHTVVVSAPTRKSWQTKVTLAVDGSTVSVAVPELETASSGAAPAAESDGAGVHAVADVSLPNRGNRSLRVASLVALGAGAIGIGVGTAFGLRSISQRRQADDICPDPNRCPISRRDEVEGLDQGAKDAKTWATVGFVAGGVAAGAGLTFLLLTKKQASTANSAKGPEVRPWAGFLSAGFTGTF